MDDCGPLMTGRLLPDPGPGTGAGAVMPIPDAVIPDAVIPDAAGLGPFDGGLKLGRKFAICGKTLGSMFDIIDPRSNPPFVLGARCCCRCRWPWPLPLPLLSSESLSSETGSLKLFCSLHLKWCLSMELPINHPNSTSGDVLP